MEKIRFAGWSNCCRLSNGVVDLVVTADVGPRIIRFGILDDENEFKVFDDQAGLAGGDEWRPYGGHRLWLAPEDLVRTYGPDNAPVDVIEHEGGIRVTQPVAPLTGIRKQLEIRLAPHEATATITHRLANTGTTSLELAPWALSVMAPGGVGILPLPPGGTHPEDLLPSGAVVFWAYTDFSDPRWHWGRRCVLLRQDAARPGPQKAGVRGGPGWIAYARAGRLFVKRFTPSAAATYPDYGCAVETFTNADMLEIETLGPLVTLAPGTSVEHVEHWSLLRDIQEPHGDAAFEAIVRRVRQLPPPQLQKA